MEFESHREPSVAQRSQPLEQQAGEAPPGTSFPWKLPVLNLKLQRRQSQEEAHRDKISGRKAGKPGGVMEQLLCGAFAGVVSRTAIAPIDLVRVRCRLVQEPAFRFRARFLVTFWRKDTTTARCQGAETFCYYLSWLRMRSLSLGC